MALGYHWIRADAKKHPKECKHDYPKDKEMNEDGPALLVCHGIAAERGLSETGYRGKLSTFLPARNCPWKHGTLKAASIILQSNSDFQSSDHIPIMAETHESICQRQCVRLEDCTRILLATQLLQNQLRGYFGGYMSKMITLGNFEEKYLNEAIAHLVGKHAKEPAADQLRRAARKMVMDRRRVRFG